MTVKKHLRAQEIARENRLPCLYLVDSGGAFLPQQDEVFPDRDHFGRIFYNQAQMSARAHPADRRRHGPLHGGRRIRAGHVRREHHRARQGTIFLGGPPLVRPPQAKSSPPKSSAARDVHSRKSGVTDHLAATTRTPSASRAASSPT